MYFPEIFLYFSEYYWFIFHSGNILYVFWNKFVCKFRKLCFILNLSLQAELDQFIHKYGIKIDAINITKINVIKTGENGAVSVFKTLIRSDVGKQFLNVFGCSKNVRDVIEAENKENNKEIEEKVIFKHNLCLNRQESVLYGL